MQLRCIVVEDEVEGKLTSQYKLSRVGVGGWLDKLGIKLISTQVVVEVGVELGNFPTLT